MSTQAPVSAKIATPDHEILDLIKHRWSPRAFAPQRVEREKLRQLFEAARWAPSCFGEQPWRYLVAPQDDAEGHAILASCLSAGNQWARQAPVLALSAAKLEFTQSGKPNRWAHHDVGAATAYLTIQATSLGIYVHQMAGFDAAKARDLCKIPEGFEPVALMAIGYLGDPDSLPEDLRAKELSPRQRKPLSEFVFGATFGQPKL